MRVCVVGCGPSGLTTIKQLLDEGHEVTCFDRNSDVGGIWFRYQGDGGEMKAYDDMVLTISMKLMSYSDFIYDKREFVTRPKYHEYLRAYADKYGLKAHIRFNSAVDRVSKNGDGSWTIAVTSGGQRTEHQFDAVALCVGPFQKPNRTVTDLDKFTGEVVHSAQYRNPEPFRNKRVLVVGLAESGADVLRQISDVAVETTLSIRSYSFLLPRLPAERFTTDEATVRSHHYEMWVRATRERFPMLALFGDSAPTRLAFRGAIAALGFATALSQRAKEYVVRRRPRPSGATKGQSKSGRVNKIGEPALPKKMDLATPWTEEITEAINEWNRRSHLHKGNWTPKVIFCKNVSFIPNLVQGRIALNDRGIDRIERKRVHFKGGESREFDVIVLCTGFVKDFSLLGDSIHVKENNVRHLYKHAFHPDHDGRLAFIGFVRPFSGGIPVCAEMQARYFAQLCSDKIRLPIDVRERIAQEKRWEEVFTELSPRHTESIPSQIFFMDSIAREIGALPSFFQLVTDPRLLLKLWFYPFNQACYRMQGPHALAESSRQEILNETPGPFTHHIPILLFSTLAMLPPFIHPKDADQIGPGRHRRDPFAAAARPSLRPVPEVAA